MEHIYTNNILILSSIYRLLTYIARHILREKVDHTAMYKSYIQGLIASRQSLVITKLATTVYTVKIKVYNNRFIKISKAVLCSEMLGTYLMKLHQSWCCGFVHIHETHWHLTLQRLKRFLDSLLTMIRLTSRQCCLAAYNNKAHLLTLRWLWRLRPFVFMQPFLSAAASTLLSAAAAFPSSVLSGWQAAVSELWGRKKKKKNSDLLLSLLMRTFPSDFSSCPHS